MSLFELKLDHKAIVAKYFSHPENEIRLKKGETLLEQNQVNEKLFYVAKGKLSGYLPDKNLTAPVFEAHADSFVGVYSFFSKDNKSYSRVLAEEESVVNYYNGNPFDLPDEDSNELLAFLFKIVIIELRSRQHFAGKVAKEHESALHKLIQTEKLATLGQMSAGLAHELNNTIGSLNGNLRQFEKDIAEHVERDEPPIVNQYFLKALNEGQRVSSLEARNARAKWDKSKGLDKIILKRLSKSGLEPKDLPSDAHTIERIAAFWNVGYLLHDMRVATEQAAHVINSVKQMGISNQSWSKDVDLNATAEDALAIVRSLTKKVELKVDLAEDLPLIEACSGELVQVWINLIKNAIESLLNHKVPEPKLWVSTSKSANHVMMTVRDNGIGIPADIIGRIYEPSFTTKVRGLSLGLGLGLTIVQRIVDEHVGKILLTSKPGETVFNIRLKAPRT